MFRIVLPVFSLLCLLLASHATLTANRLDLFVLAQLAINTLYLVSAWILARSPLTRRQLAALCIGALALRAVAFPLEPALSDDVFRYRWEGKLQAAGANPYQVKPADETWRHVRDETYQRVGSKDFKAGYGPVIELLERGWYVALSGLSVRAQVIWFKLPFALGELLVLLLTCRLVGTQRFAWYALAPLPVVEVWWNGHNDAIVIATVVGAVLAARANRWGLSFSALGLGIAAKWWPALLIPAFVSRCPARARWKVLLTAVPLCLSVIPYWSNVRSNAEFMTGFFGGWRNNDSLYGLVLWIFVEPAAAKRATAAIIGLLAVLFALTDWTLERKCLASITALLLFSSNCHPWYLLWIWPFVALYPSAPYLLWGALMPLAYSVLEGWRTLREWDGSTPERWLIYGPLFLIAALHGAFLDRTALMAVLRTSEKVFRRLLFSYPRSL